MSIRPFETIALSKLPPILEWVNAKRLPLAFEAHPQTERSLSVLPQVTCRTQRMMLIAPKERTHDADLQSSETEKAQDVACINLF